MELSPGEVGSDRTEDEDEDETFDLGLRLRRSGRIGRRRGTGPVTFFFFFFFSEVPVVRGGQVMQFRDDMSGCILSVTLLVLNDWRNGPPSLGKI